MIMWGAFAALIVGLLIFDFIMLNQKTEELSLKSALAWCGFWVLLALLFDLGIYFFSGSEKALLFLTGYIVEESLSMDNLFVFLMIFTYFRLPRKYQPKLLFWGILFAILLRVLFIFAGVTLIQKFHWILYVFGVFLVITGIKLAWEKEHEIKPEKNLVVRLFKYFMEVKNDYTERRYFVKDEGKLKATPLFIVLLLLPSVDLVFAVDSIPAILAITTDPFIVITSNIFAVLGLRAFFFVLEKFIRIFHYLNYGLSLILVFIGFKMLITDLYKMPTTFALGFIVAVLAAAIVASVIWKPTHRSE